MNKERTTLKKRWLLSALLLALVAVAGCSKEVKYNISGRIPSGLDVQTIYLVDPLTQSPIDSTMVAADSTFRLQGTVSEPMIAIVAAKEMPQLQWVLIVEKGKIVLDETDGSVKGSKQNDEYAAFEKSIYDLYQTNPQELEDKMPAMAEDFILEHRNDLNGVRVLHFAVASGMIDEERFMKIYDECGDFVQQHEIVSSVRQMIEAQNASNVGNKFIDLSGTCDGKAVRLSDFAGQGDWVLLDFWASWCRPCREEMPYIKKALEQYGSKGLKVVGVAVSDKSEATKAAMAELGITWPVIVDTDVQEISGAWGFNSIPQIFLIDPTGTIVAKELSGDSILETISKMLL